MLLRLRRYLTYANVVSTLCLFVLLGGSAYAATKIGSKQIKDNSIKSKDIKNNGIQGKDVKNRSLTDTDFKAGSLPPGATGAAGPPGPQGAAAPKPGPVIAVKPPAGADNCKSPSGTGQFCLSPHVGLIASNAAGYQPVGFYRDGFGVVHLQGSAVVNSDAGPPFVLPLGYRPAAKRVFAIDVDPVGSDVREHESLEVTSDGKLRLVNSVNVDRVSFDGVYFRP